MKQKRFKPEQIVAILKEPDSGVPVRDLCPTLRAQNSKFASTL